MRKLYMGFIIGAVILAVLFPISLNFFIGENEILNFSIKSAMSKDAWLGFWGSYLGAIGTIILGISTYLQSKKYNDMSSHFVEEQRKILENIEVLNKQQQITIKANKYYEVLENYRVKIDHLITIFEKYNPSWAASFFSSLKDRKEEQALTLYNAMRDDFMSILIQLRTDIYFFEGKELLYDECYQYRELLSKQCDNIYEDFDVNKMKEINETYSFVYSKFMKYKLKIELYQKKVLSGAKTIEEIQNDFAEMEDKVVAWFGNLKNSQ